MSTEDTERSAGLSFLSCTQVYIYTLTRENKRNLRPTQKMRGSE